MEIFFFQNEYKTSTCSKCTKLLKKKKEREKKRIKYKNENHSRIFIEMEWNRGKRMNRSGRIKMK